VRRGHHPDTARNRRQPALRRRVEEALAREARTELLEGDLERAAPARLEVPYQQLETSRRAALRNSAARSCAPPSFSVK
jgi:hypothetical protein